MLGCMGAPWDMAMWGVDMVRSILRPGGIWPGLYAFAWPSSLGPRGMKLPSGKYPMFCNTYFKNELRKATSKRPVLLDKQCSHCNDRDERL